MSKVFCGWKKFAIYGLADPHTQEIRYIGRSSWGKKRPLGHLQENSVQRHKKLHVYSWIKKLEQQRLKPEIVKLAEWDHIDTKDLDLAEMQFMWFFKSKGCRLTNADYAPNTLYGRKRSPEEVEALKKANTQKKAVIRSDGVIFQSIQEAARQTTCSHSEIWSNVTGHIKGYKRTLTVKGYSFALYDFNNPIIPEVPLTRKPTPYKIKRSDGVVFDSIEKAAKEMGCSPTNIQGMLKGRTKSVYGYKFERIE